MIITGRISITFYKSFSLTSQKKKFHHKLSIFLPVEYFLHCIDSYTVYLPSFRKHFLMLIYKPEASFITLIDTHIHAHTLYALWKITWKFFFFFIIFTVTIVIFTQSFFLYTLSTTSQTNRRHIKGYMGFKWKRARCAWKLYRQIFFLLFVTFIRIIFTQ